MKERVKNLVTGLILGTEAALTAAIVYSSYAGTVDITRVEWTGAVVAASTALTLNVALWGTVRGTGWARVSAFLVAVPLLAASGWLVLQGNAARNGTAPNEVELSQEIRELRTHIRELERERTVAAGELAQHRYPEAQKERLADIRESLAAEREALTLAQAAEREARIGFGFRAADMGAAYLMELLLVFNTVLLWVHGRGNRENPTGGGVPQEPVLVPQEPVLVPQEPVLVPQEPVLVPQEPVLVPQEPVLVHLENPDTGENRKGTRAELIAELGLSKGGLSELIAGKRRLVKGWGLAK